MKDQISIIERDAQALESINSSIPVLLEEALCQNDIARIIDRTFFTPEEDEEIAYWFARFITLRSNLWMIIDSALINKPSMDKLLQPSDWQHFVLGYSAACSMRHLDRFLISKVANHSVIQRKLNEPFPAHRIARKQYSRIYSEMFLPSNAVLIHLAHRRLNRHRNKIEEAVRNASIEPIYENLHRQERYIDLSKRNFVAAWLRNRWHSLRRRGASAKQKSVFRTLEYSGRFVSELSLPRSKKVTPAVIEELEKTIKPGDIFITRHNRALTNLFLPGFWPHAALYIGSTHDRERMKISAEQTNCKYWSGNNRTFEALKDGVHFRPLEETLSVDAFVLLRPKLSTSEVAEAIARVIVHAGKGYNFDFDFFRSDHLVCTEVIYRAYDGIGGVSIPLQDRMGRKALSAEDILDLAMDTTWADPVAIFGVGKSKKNLVVGEDVRCVLESSYRSFSEDINPI